LLPKRNGAEKKEKKKGSEYILHKHWF